MPDGQLTVSRGIACAEAGAAEGCPHHSTGSNQLLNSALAQQVQHDCLRAGIHTQREGMIAGALAVQQISSFHNIGVRAAGTACDGALIRVQRTITNLLPQI